MSVSSPTTSAGCSGWRSAHASTYSGTVISPSGWTTSRGVSAGRTRSCRARTSARCCV
ncbi:hypothetical protein ACQBJO_03015 [Janibacter sp. G349]|uniref:hypothetical protein n=1 Tax=Janibacter sp. G349 TaxID=3405424 RepID=UPI003D2DF420